MIKKIFTGMVLSLLLICGCDEFEEKTYLPPRAENVVDYGNGWMRFDLDGKRYLWHMQDPGSQDSTESLACIGDVPEPDNQHSVNPINIFGE